MNVILINPPRFNNIPVIREERCEVTERYSVVPPYSLLQIGALLQISGHGVTLIDANGENCSYDTLIDRIAKEKFEVAIFRFTPTTFDHDMKTPELIKKINPSAITVGICFTLQSEARDVLNQAHALDIYVRKEYEVVVPDLILGLTNGSELSGIKGIAFRSNGEIVLTPEPEPLEDYDSLPLPAYNLLESLNPYFINTPSGKPFMIIYTSKGCPFQCIYCTVAGTKLKSRSAESVLSELVYLKEKYGIRTVSFFDETFTIDKERVIEICNGIMDEGLQLRWYCNTRVHLVDYNLLRLMKRAGCDGISFGIESGSQKILDRAKKGCKVETGYKAIKMAKKAGIKVYTSFILGLPGETWDTVNETIAFVKKAKPTGAQFNVAVPYPGTRLYEEALNNNWIPKGLNWNDLYQHDSIMNIGTLSADDLNRARKMAYRKLYLNIPWILQNIAWVIKYPRDMPMAIKFYKKALTNLFVHRMVHTH